MRFILALSLLSVTPSLADTPIKARYEITVAGFRIGMAGLEGNFSDTNYSAALSVKLSGLAKMMAAGAGTADVSGSLSNGKASPQAYNLNLEAGEKNEAISIGFGGNTIRSLSAEPSRPLPQGTIPVTSAHKINVLDPFSAGVFTSQNAAEQMGQDACAKNFPVFDGRQRYDMSFSYARTAPLKAIGYRGEALVCKARYTPISGHVAGRADIQFLQNNKNMEIWLVPVRGTKNFIPARIKIETQIGMAVIEPIRLDVGAEQQARVQ
jgi:Protein of unknown function (DUF3108)